MKKWLSKSSNKTILFIDIIFAIYYIATLFFFINTEAFDKVGYYIILIVIPILTILRHIIPIDQLIINLFMNYHDEGTIILISIIMFVIMGITGCVSETTIYFYSVYFGTILFSTMFFVKKDSLFPSLYFSYAIPVYIMIINNLYKIITEIKEYIGPGITPDNTLDLLTFIFALIIHTYITLSALNYIFYQQSVDEYYKSYIDEKSKKYAPQFNFEHVNQCSREVMSKQISKNLFDKGPCICVTGLDYLDFDFGVLANDTPYGKGTYLVNGHLDSREIANTCFYFIDNNWEKIEVKVKYVDHNPIYCFNYADKPYELTMEEFEKNFIGYITAFIPETKIFSLKKDYHCISMWTPDDLYEEAEDYRYFLRKSILTPKD